MKERELAGYTRYPLVHVLIYNGATFLHYIVGTVGIVIGYGAGQLAWVLGGLYALFSFVQMYIIMPLVVCPNCVYTRLPAAVCVSGLNVVSRKLTKLGQLNNFKKRAEGVFCHNNLYMASLLIPILALIPVLFIDFSVGLLALVLGLAGLMAFRVFIIFKKIACVNCRAKHSCPNAISMGLAKNSREPSLN